MSLQTLFNALGGLALFLLAMAMMTEGLKAFAGAGLKRILERWTSTPARGVLAGILVTALVQSSSAVTVAAIGFVNAGVLTLRQALGVIYGTNVGTTMTGWLVSLVGFGFRIENFALPLLALGVALRLGGRGTRGGGLGEALAGFGLFFLGLAILKDAFGGLAAAYGAGIAAGGGGGHWSLFLLVGLVATVLTQSSSAAIALILTAVASGAVGVEAGAAAVIGANLGTTSTAAVAVIRATASAKRLALGHIAFNLITAAAALALLPGLIALVDRLAGSLQIGGGPAAFLALFHTVFNLLGVAIMLPLSNRLAARLERAFRSAEEELARPQHLDATLTATPAFALAALREELARLRGLAVELARAALAGHAPADLDRRVAALRALGEAIADFVGAVGTESMPRVEADALAQALRVARYLDEVARRTPVADRLRAEAGRCDDVPARDSVRALIAAAEACLAFAARGADEPQDDAARAEALGRFELAYAQSKGALLGRVVNGRLAVDAADRLLDAASATCRLVEQAVKADRLLRTPGRAAAIEREEEQGAAAAGALAGRAPGADR
jgi:phosphate:Na+ symporter